MMLKKPNNRLAYQALIFFREKKKKNAWSKVI